MPSQRLKGQEVEILLVVDGEVQDTLTEVQNFEVIREMETKEEDYLGEKTSRYDDFYKGYSGKLDLHLSNPGIFDVMQAIQDRAQRREPGTQINIKATLNWPSGERKRYMLLDAFFESMPLTAGGRGEYVASSLSFKGSETRVL